MAVLILYFSHRFAGFDKLPNKKAFIHIYVVNVHHAGIAVKETRQTAYVRNRLHLSEHRHLLGFILSMG